MRVLVVGLNPSKLGGSSPSLKRLYMWMDLLNLSIFSFTNLYEGYEIKNQHPTLFKIKDYSKEYDKVICLGQVVSNYLSRMDIDHFRLPHPSGLNRQLNDENLVHEMISSCKNYLER